MDSIVVSTMQFMFSDTRNYVTTWFTVDLLGTFPFERLINAKSSSRKSLKLIKYFKIPKLLRVSRLLKYIRVHKHMYDIFQVIVLVLTCLHVGACFWMAVLNPCAEDKENYAGDDLCSQGRIYSLYAEVFHLSTAMMLGVSNMNVISKSSIMDLLIHRREESHITMYVISSVYMVTGLILMSLLIGEMNVYLMGIMQGSTAFQRKIDRVNHEMEYYAVPDELQRQVRAFYDYIWIHQKQFDHKIALLSDENMSTDLQRKLALHMFKDFVSHIAIFSGIDDLVLGEICLSLRTRIFLPHDMIIVKGDIGKELFIISKGSVEVLRDDLPPDKRLNASPILLQSGSFFGEIALIMEVRRTCSVQARTICEVNLLDQKAFDAILRDNPEFARRMNELVVVRQLEKTMTRNSQKGVDYQVSKDDYDRAYDAVSKQMREGLERRMKKTCKPGTHHSSPSYDMNEPFESNSCTHIQDEVSSDDNSVSSVRTEGQDRSLKKNRSNKSSNVSQIMIDITRRSMRFVNETSKLNLEISHCNSCCSDSEMDVDHRHDQVVTRKTNDHDNTTKRRRRSMLELTGGSSRLQGIRGRPMIAKSGNEYDETMQATGHFNPDQSIVDINKVHPSILNRGDVAIAHSSCEGKIKVLGARFEAHDAFMSKLFKKLEKIESWLRNHRKQDHEDSNVSHISTESNGDLKPICGEIKTQTSLPSLS